MLIESFNDFLALAGSNVIITGLVVWLGKVWSERIARNEKAEIDTRLKKLEQDYDNTKVTDERKHQIAQEAYRNFFNTKMNAYIKLVELKREYSKELSFRISPIDYDPTDFVAIPQIEIIIKHIHENEIYLNESLIEKFKQWYIPVSQAIGKEKLNIELGKYRDLPQDDKMEIEATYETEIYAKYQNDFHAFLDEVDSDIKGLRKKYDL